MCWLGRIGRWWRGWTTRGMLVLCLLLTPVSLRVFSILGHAPSGILPLFPRCQARYDCKSQHLHSQTLNPNPCIRLHISAINLHASANSSHPHREELWNERLGLKKRDLKDVVWRIVQGEQV